MAAAEEAYVISSCAELFTAKSIEEIYCRMMNINFITQLNITAS